MENQQIAPDVWWVGTRNADTEIECNPYLILDGDEAVLVDPGSVLEFSRVLESVKKLVDPERVKLMIVNHPDPDIASGIPLFEEAGFRAPLALHWRSSVLMKFYGGSNPHYLVNQNAWMWAFKSGRTLRFMPAPYCHFPGSILTWDEKSGVLFSGDLFGSLIASPDLFADDAYIEGMKSFHEHYIPAQEVLAPVMDSIAPLPIRVIAPQHGRVIVRNIPQHIQTLKALECGIYLGQTRASAGEESFSQTEKKRRRPELQELRQSFEADKAMPEMFDLNTKLMNGTVWLQYLSHWIAKDKKGEESLLVFSIDNLEEINQMRGRAAGDEALAVLAYLLRNSDAAGSWKIFKMNAPYIAVSADNSLAESFRETIEKIRMTAAEARYTLDPLILSVGMLAADQIPATGDNLTTTAVERLLLGRLFCARKIKSGGICDAMDGSESEKYLKRRVLLIEPDDSYVEFLKPAFTELGILLETAADGQELLRQREDQLPDLVISAAMTPVVNGFDLYTKLRNTRQGKDIPFILISRRKDEEYIMRAAETGIVHYLKKPFYKAELMGLVSNLLGASR
ncbi:MAG: response regulator [Spirochaetales bacterium]|nr:response regulator [Spirochaetales bacterium]